MITVNNAVKFSNKKQPNDMELKGLSTDVKPTEVNGNIVGVNSIFLELDTNDFYYFDGEEWQKVVIEGGGSGEYDRDIAEIRNELKKRVYYFDNVASMKSSNDLKSGEYVVTKGYYEKNDGGGASYLIRAKTEEDVDDGGSVHFIGNNLVAELIIKDNTVNVKQFGAKGDGENDDTISIQNAITNYTNIVGFINERYYITNSINVNNKNLNNLNLKAEPFRADVGNTYFDALNLTGNNNLTNVNVESEFKYIPSIEIYVNPSSQNGLASNVHAFNITNGITNFYNCKANYCWAFNIRETGEANIYNFIGLNLEMSFFVSSNKAVKVYDSQFTINKLINSTYYHHIYAIQGSDTEFNNCEFLEVGEGVTGNHYHGYSTSFTEQMNVTGKMVINNCKLISTAWMGQINGVNLYINGGEVDVPLLLSSGSAVDKPTAYFKNVKITINASNTSNDYPLSYSRVNIENCYIKCTGQGTKFLSTIAYKIYNSIIDILNGTFSNHVLANADSIVSEEIVMNNCIVNSNSYAWCYPYYCTNVKILNCLFNLSQLKTTSNPGDRGSVGFLFNCIFKNWTLPLNVSNTNTLKYDYIYDNIKKSNIN